MNQTIPVVINGTSNFYPNQDEPLSIMTQNVFDFAIRRYLPSLMAIHSAIERVSGHRWKPTSYMRDSPSHKNGSALDIAPDIYPSDAQYYAAFNKSDPVLYARVPLINQLTRVSNSLKLPYKWGMYVENDHIHIGLFTTKLPGLYKGEVNLWGSPKWIYPDTDERMASFQDDYDSIVKSKY